MTTIASRQKIEDRAVQTDRREKLARLGLADSQGFLDHRLMETLRLEDFHPAAEAQDPADQLAGIGDRQNHTQAAAFGPLRLLCGMPDAILHPGRGGLVEFQLHLDARATHDRERVLHERIEIKMQRHLIGVIGRGDGLDPLHRKHAARAVDDRRQ